MSFPPLPNKENNIEIKSLIRNIDSLFTYLERLRQSSFSEITTVITNDPTIITNVIDAAFDDTATIAVSYDPITGIFSINVKDLSIIAGKIASNAISTVKVLDNNITYSKIQNVTAGKLLGRNPASTGNVQEITLGTGLSLTGTTLNSAGTGNNLTLVPIMTGFIGTPGGLPILYQDGELVSEFVFNDLGSILMAEITI